MAASALDTEPLNAPFRSVSSNILLVKHRVFNVSGVIKYWTISVAKNSISKTCWSDWPILLFSTSVTAFSLNCLFTGYFVFLNMSGILLGFRLECSYSGADTKYSRLYTKIIFCSRIFLNKRKRKFILKFRYCLDRTIHYKYFWTKLNYLYFIIFSFFNVIIKHTA